MLKREPHNTETKQYEYSGVSSVLQALTLGTPCKSALKFCTHTSLAIATCPLLIVAAARAQACPAAVLTKLRRRLPLAGGTVHYPPLHDPLEALESHTTPCPAPCGGAQQEPRPETKSRCQPAGAAGCLCLEQRPEAKGRRQPAGEAGWLCPPKQEAARAAAASVRGAGAGRCL